MLRRITWRVLIASLGVGCALLLGACTGSDATTDSGWAIVKVELSEAGSPLEAICIGPTCKLFEQSDDVRDTEFSAFVSSGATMSIRRFGDQEGATGPAPAGGCTLVRISPTSTDYTLGCEP